MSPAALLALVALTHAAEPASLDSAANGAAPAAVDTPIALTGTERGAEAVVGGTQVPEGRWDDAVGIVFYGSDVGCTGTLIGPEVVLTAGHCVGGITHVLVGSKDYTKNGGEIVEVERTIEYPNSWNTYDAAILLLRAPSTYPPRAVAIDCLIDDYLENGIEVQVVGFGGTQANGGGWNTRLNEGTTIVQTAECDVNYVNGTLTGCNSSVSPGGEIGAGGNGVDACYGDSGGPLYLLTPEGDFVVGVTSRAYWGVPNNYPCRDGGIYARPDAFFDWILEKADGREVLVHNCNQPPVVSVAPITVPAGSAASTWLDVQDDGEQFEVKVVTEPAHGTVVVREGGELEYQANADYLGEDSFVVRVRDDGHPLYARSSPHNVRITVPVTVEAAAPEDDGFAMNGCACRTATSPAGLAWLALPGLLALRRRRS